MEKGPDGTWRLVPYPPNQHANLQTPILPRPLSTNQSGKSQQLGKPPLDSSQDKDHLDKQRLRSDDGFPFGAVMLGIMFGAIIGAVSGMLVGAIKEVVVAATGSWLAASLWIIGVVLGATVLLAIIGAIVNREDGAKYGATSGFVISVVGGMIGLIIRFWTIAGSSGVTYWSTRGAIIVAVLGGVLGYFAERSQ